MIGQFLGAQRRLIAVLAVALAFAGLVSWLTMPRQEDPGFPERQALLTVVFPGADALTVEAEVIEPIEDAIAGVPEVEEVVSTARPDVALISIRLKDSMYVTAPVWDDVRRRVNAVSLPAEAREPVVDDRISDTMGVVVAISGATTPYGLIDALDAVEDRLEAVPGVRSAAAIGDPGEQITVALSDASARRHGLAPGALASQLAQLVAVLPGGGLAVNGQDVLIDARGTVDVRTLRDLPVQTAMGPIPLSAIASVTQGRSEPAADRMRLDGDPAVAVGLVLEEGIDTVAVGNAIDAEVEALRAELLPLSLTVLADQPDRVSKRLSGLGGSLLMGVFIVGVVLILTMGVRLGGVVAAVVPLTTLGALGVYALGGGILHQMSVAGLVLSLGLLVDNAIVVAERVQWHIDRGASGADAAARAVQELGLPLVAATGTTVASFLPLLLSTGPTGDFTRAIPQVVILTLVLSLAVALLVTPSLAGVFFRPNAQGERPVPSWLSWLSEFPTRAPGRVALLAMALVVVAGAAGPFVRFQFFPAADRNQLVVSVELPEGSDVELTDAASQRLERALRNDPRVKTVAAFVGRSTPPFYYNLPRLPSSPQLAQLMLITESAEDVTGVLQLARDVARDAVPEGTFVGRRLEQGPPLAAPVELRFTGHDLDALWLASNEVAGRLVAATGSADVRHTASQGIVSLGLQPSDASLARVGLTRRDVALSTLGRTQGLGAGRLRRGRREIPVRVRSEAGETLPVEQLVSAAVWSPTHGPVPLASVAAPSVQLKPAVVRRRDGVRETVVLSELDGTAGAGDVLAEVREQAQAIAARHGVRMTVGGEAQGSGEANGAILLAAPIGGAMLLAFLLAQFRSFRRVGIILLTVPLAAVGVAPGLLVFGQPFGFTALLGLIALVGIVVNNAIILVDYADTEVAAGQSVADAVATAVQVRFRPILLTTATTIAGLVPLLLSSSTLWPPLAAAMISGLAASTVLTLWVVPAAYALLFGRRGSMPGVGGVAALAVALLVALPASATTLQQAQEAALDAHPELQLARLEVQRLDAQRALALSAFAPRVGLSASYNVSASEIVLDPTDGLALPKTSDLEPVFAAFHDADQVEAVFDGVRAEEANTPGLEPIVVRRKSFADGALSVELPVWSPGSLQATRAVSAQRRAAALDAQWAEAEVRAGVVAAYWGAYVADRSVQVAERAQQRAIERVAVAEARVEAGRSTAIDRIESELALAEATTALRDARLAQTQGREALHRLTDLPVDVVLQEPPALPAVVSAVAERSDVLAARERVDASRAAVRAERGAWMPAVDAFWSGTWSQNQGFQAQQTFWTGGIRARWALWDGGARIARARSQATQTAQARIQADALAADALAEQRQARRVLESARGAREAAQARVSLAQEALRLREQAVAAGLGATQDALDAALVADQAALGLWAARGAEARAVAELMRVGVAAE